ncbi:MAG: tyrosine-type recombinase/integrase [Kiritimatiellae bacterium]|jgi:site-specific recombinase XerC|nr:tyrosine-type recombinase/integrase [Kiritimatiellia bacterium]
MKKIPDILAKEMRRVMDARKIPLVPVVLSQEELEKIFSRMEEPHRLIAELLYGCGLRLTEGLTLRIEQLNLAHRILTVHRGKGRKDRAMPLPECLLSRLESHLRSVRNQFDEDVEAGFAARLCRRAVRKSGSGVPCSGPGNFCFLQKL